MSTAAVYPKEEMVESERTDYLLRFGRRHDAYGENREGEIAVAAVYVRFAKMRSSCRCV